MTDLIVKDNALIQASYTLSLVEQRLILLAIIEARETGEGIDHTSLLRIHASSYANQFNIEQSNAYELLKEASQGIFDRYVTYHDKNPTTGKDRSFHCRWVDKVGYEKSTGMVYLRFTSDVVPLITRLEEQFTSYELEQVAQLSSSYAVRLYELLIQWRSLGKTPLFEIDTFRKQLGVQEGKYSRMSDFKKYVLKFAIDQINKYTDIKVSYVQLKDGRKIKGFVFKFKNKNLVKAEKSPRDENTPDMLSALKMTDKQREFYSSKLAKMVELSKYSLVGEDYSQFSKRIAADLLDENKQQLYLPYLEKLGFRQTQN